ncbi:hypothetical protein QFC20_007735 [Naganishia adeliensis]|uniref:Uncharacterized protein n=1 Tax=Naganishia adeliensis TaxID=92952 RepID=A0ACC2UVP6_9TREE|nr:hypothetical protein QFC20_007735 [Naganishia adeliensis]
MLAGVLAISTPTIVGSFVPTYTPYILAAVSFLIAAVQMIGFYGVFKVSSVEDRAKRVPQTCIKRRFEESLNERMGKAA